MAGVALGPIAAPALVHAVGARWAFVVAGAILPVLALVSYRALAAIDRSLLHRSRRRARGRRARRVRQAPALRLLRRDRAPAGRAPRAAAEEIAEAHVARA